MFESISSLCDDFCVDMHINTELELPSQRETLLGFFERIQKQFPSMGNFYRHDNGQLCLEEDRELRRYRWVGIDVDRIASGYVNPPAPEDANLQHRLVIDLVPFMLGVSHLDIDCLDVIYRMDFDCQANHDEVIADAFFAGTAFTNLLDLPHSKPIGFSPAISIALSDDCRTQGRISIESKTSTYEIRRGQYHPDEAISLCFTIRQYPKPDEKFNASGSFDKQCALAVELMDEKIVPGFVQPLVSSIAQRR